MKRLTIQNGSMSNLRPTIQFTKSLHRILYIISLIGFFGLYPLHSFSQEEINQLSTKIAATDTFTTETDSLALVALYNATDGAHWVLNLNWLTGPIHTWYGISLDANNRVNFIDLANLNLSGSIPIEIGNLTALVGLNLKGNQLVGSIPNELGRLVNLQEIHLNSNLIDGTIPNTIGDLINLRILNFANNQLTGQIPVELGKLTKLKELNLSSNKMEGNLPVELGKLNLLRVLNLSSNLFRGNVPVEIANLPILSGFNIYNNFFEELPAMVSPFLNDGTDDDLWINENYFTFTSLIRNEDKLTDQYRCLPQKNLPINISNITVKMGDTVTLDFEQLVGRKLGDDSTQYYLSNGNDYILSDNGKPIFIIPVTKPISTTFFCWFSHPHFFEAIETNRIRINIAVDSTFQDSITLVNFYRYNNGGSNTLLQKNWLKGPVSTWGGVVLDENRRVVELNLSNCGLDGVIYSGLSNLTKLKRLDLSNNHFEPITVSLSNLVNLEYLNLSYCSISGNLPNEIGELVKLKHLYLNNNYLEGEVPESIGRNTNLINFNIAQNRFNRLPFFESKNFSMNSNEGLIVAYNSFTFNDLEPNADNLNYLVKYSPQNSIPLMYTNIEALLGDTAKLNIENIANRDLGGNNNKYMWYKDGVEISKYTSSSTLIIPNMSPANEGIYKCKIMNDFLPALTLETEEFNLVYYEDSILNDSLALVDLYNSMSGQSWFQNTNWLEGDIDTWYGIKLNSNKRVTEILLQNNNLKGALPLSLRKLSRLEKFDLSNNSCSGEIPDVFHKFKSLIILNFSHNQFSGNLPKSIENMLSLGHLDVSHNQLSGGLAQMYIYQIEGLEYINLSYNQFSGTVPSFYGYFYNLHTFNIENNYFTHINEFYSDKLDTTEFEGLRLNNNYLFESSLRYNSRHLNYKSKYFPQRILPLKVSDSTIYTDQKIDINFYSLSKHNNIYNSKFRWYKNGVALGGWSSNPNYTISSASFQDSGIYYCEFVDPEFKNGDIIFQTDSFTLKVLENPYPLKIEAIPTKIISGNSAYIPFNLITNAFTTVYLTYQNNASNILYQNLTTDSSGTYMFYVRNLTPYEKYYYTIEAKTAYGSTITKILEITAFSEGQNVIKFTEPTNINSRSADIHVSLNVNLNTTAILYYSTQSGGKDLSSDTVQLSRNENLTFNLKKLKPGTTYYYYLSATNTLGDFESLVYSFTTPCDYILNNIEGDDLNMCAGNTMGVYNVNVPNFSNLHWIPTNGEIVYGQNALYATVNWHVLQPNYSIKVEYTDTAGCKQTVEQDVFVRGAVLYTPLLKAKKNRNYFLIAYNKHRVISYTWYHDGVPIPNANNQIFSVPEDKRYGSYMVELYTNNGCRSKSNFIVFNKNGEIDDLETIAEDNELNIYPNPASDVFEIELSNEYHGQGIVSILDATGRVHKTVQFYKNAYIYQFSVPLESLQGGMYYIKIQLGNNPAITKQLVIK